MVVALDGNFQLRQFNRSEDPSMVFDPCRLHVGHYWSADGNRVVSQYDVRDLFDFMVISLILMHL